MTPCPACTHAETLSFARFEEWAVRHPFAAWYAERPYARFEHFLACGGCGLRFVDRMPSAEDLAAFYRDYYGSAGYSQKRSSKLRRATRRIKRLMYTPHLTSPRKRGEGKTFLDVGCNLGFAVEAAHRLGFAATGIEIDARAVEQAAAMFPHARFFASTAEAFAAREERFDVVHCSEVIEHTTDPRGFVQNLHTLLNPGGTLFLTTPDVGHIAHLFSRFETWPEVKPPEHLLWFSKRSMRALLASQGLDIVSFWPSLKPQLKVVARKP